MVLRHSALLGFPCAFLAFALAVPSALLAQSSTPVTRSRPLITEKIDETKRHTLAGNLRPEANAANDRGRVADDLAMEHMLLQLQRPPEQEQAFQQFIDQLHTPGSPNFHKWLTAEQVGQMYGPAQQDLNTVTGWLTSHGFTVNQIYPSGMLIDFSGNAGQVSDAFHTEIHNLEVHGQKHIANMSDPEIPEALSSVVAGVVSLHDFQPHAMKKDRPAYTYTSKESTYQALVPADLATIYNINPLFSTGITGKGQTIVLIEDTDLYSTADWTTFRTTFGLSKYSGTLTTVHPAPPSGASNCADPGVVRGNDGEAALDVEWAGAAAPDAAIQLASCADTRTTFGGLIALQNLLATTNPPSIVSISYGECEAENGASANLSFYTAYQLAAARGVSVFVSAGDEGAASCDAGATAASHGIGVSGWASTPYNVAVGGTDFSDSYSGTNSTYWSPTNSSTYGSAMSYIPEIPWNSSCAGELLSHYLDYSTPYGSSGFCGSSTASSDGLLQVAAGSGGPSGCATGAPLPSEAGVVSGTCKGYPKPTWQRGTPADGVRDIPDVSLFASNGLWGHYYVYCYSDIRGGGAACTGAPSTWAGAGGTSFSSPILAGIQALVNQYKGGAQGNPNVVYYALASNSSIFHSITQGDMAVNCSGTLSCFGATTSTSRFGRSTANGNGVLSLSGSSYVPAYGASSGWNFATGIGSVNAYNLVMGW
jgi:subtilase family serine protease